MNEHKDFEVKKICFNTAAGVIMKAMEIRQVKTPHIQLMAQEILTLAIELEKYSRQKKYWQSYKEGIEMEVKHV